MFLIAKTEHALGAGSRGRVNHSAAPSEHHAPVLTSTGCWEVKAGWLLCSLHDGPLVGLGVCEAKGGEALS